MSTEGMAYKCMHCNKATCICDRTTERDSVQWEFKSFICCYPECPMELFYCINDYNNHVELNHSKPVPFIPEVPTSTNGSV